MEGEDGKVKMFWQINPKLRFASRKAWKVFKGDKVALGTLSFIFLLFLVAVFCYMFIPDRTQLVNRMSPPIGNQRPGFEVMMLRVMDNKSPEQQSFFSRAFHGIRSNDTYIAISSSRYVGTDIIVREFSASGDSSFESRYNIADVVYPLNPEKKITERSGGLFFEKTDGTVVGESINDLQAIINGQYLITKKFILGTDRFGRDVFSRLIAATRVTVFCGLIVVLISVTIGLVAGLLTGVTEGKIKSFITWCIYSAGSIPGLLLTAAVMFTIGNGFFKVCFAASAVLWVHVAKIIHQKIKVTVKQPFIEHTKALGLSRRHVFKRHILPEINRPLVAAASSVFCSAVLLESGLSFLGIGIQDPLPSWGTMVRENAGYIIVPGYEHLTLLPGLAILIVSFASVLLSNRVHANLKESDNQVLV